MILVLVLSIYMLVHGERIGNLVRRAMPPGNGSREDDYPSLVVSAVAGYVRAQLLFSLVMGAGAGIGAATVQMLVAEGACVVAADRDSVAAADAVADLPSEQVLAHAMDVRSAADARQGVAAAMDRWGRLDSIVCNAGIGAFGGILDYADEHLLRIVDTNLMGTIWTVRAANGALRCRRQQRRHRHRCLGGRRWSTR